MTERCAQDALRERALAGELWDAEEQARWRRHVASCTVCRTQASVDAGLRRVITAVPPPPVPAGFVERFERRRAAVGTSNQRTWLRVYWAGFTAVSAWVLAGIDWTRFDPWRSVLGIVWLGLLVSSPLLALVGPFRSLVEGGSWAPSRTTGAKE